VCHNGKTKAVSAYAYVNHRRHGDPSGPCPRTPTTGGGDDDDDDGDD
jgi:hypothetical protein